MAQVQRHRGPDDQGFRLFSLASGQSEELTPEAPPPQAVFEGGVGFNRLSILDLSRNGHQPMCTDDGRVFIAFNGEVYNSFDYRADLEARGVTFRSHTDTEILLYLYRVYGFEEMLARTNGMFAICIVDLDRREILLARDRLGIKPLYLAECRNSIFFSSEVKSFLRIPGFPRDVDPRQIDECLLFRYCAEDRFLLRAVKQVRPGSWVRITADGMRCGSFWSIPDGEERRLTMPAAMGQLEDLLERSVRRRLLSDVKVGCQLSGGIDSTLTSIIARSHLGADMDAFSVVFADPAHSEKRWIDQAAEKVDAVSHQHELTRDYFLRHLDKATWHLDQPINHPNSIGIYFLAENACRCITVFLSGEGADELFGGYTRFYYAMMRPALLRTWPVLSRLPRYGSHFSRVFGDASIGPEDWFILSSAYQTPETATLLRPDAQVDQVLAQRRAMFDRGTGSYLSRCLRYELRSYMVDLLMRQDKMTMAHSMENRVPFIDHELVEFARSLPSHMLVRRRLDLRRTKTRNTKVILKRLAAQRFGHDFVYRTKRGFSIPLRDYFADKAFTPLMEERVLPGIRERGWVDHRRVRDWWQQGQARPAAGREGSVWVAVALELWAQQFVDA